MSPALAATSEESAPDGVGFVWYNAGTHNMDKGRNSFTVKDDHCGDGFKPFVYYEIYDNRNADGTYQGLLAKGQVVAEDCTEVSRSAYGPPATTDYIRWVPAKRRLATGAKSTGTDGTTASGNQPERCHLSTPCVVRVTG